MAGGDGWVCSNRFCRLGCRFSVPCIVSIDVLCALYMCMFNEIWIMITNYMRLICLLEKGKIVVYCCSFILGFVMYRRLSVHGVTVLVLFLCKCAFCIVGSAISPVWLFFFKSFLERGYVFGGRSPSTNPGRIRCSGFMYIMCLLAQIRVGREAMWYVFFRPLGGPWSGSLSRLVG